MLTGGSPKQPRGRKRSSDSVSPVAGPSGRQVGGQGARLSNVNTSSTLGPGLESRYNAGMSNIYF